MVNEEESIEEKLIGLEAQEKKLESIILNFKNSGQGNSCVLSGRRGSGKSTLLNKLLARHFDNLEDLFFFLDGDEHTTAKPMTDQGLLNKISCNKSEDSSSQKIIVIDHFEAFSTKQHQCFLYSVLNGSQNYPWLVFLIGTTEDSVNLLEKRIKSRLSKTRINFDVRNSHSDIINSFFTLLSWHIGQEEFEEMNIRSAGLEPLLKKFATHHCTHSSMKKLAIVFGAFIPIQFGKDISPSTLLQFCIESVWPTNEMLSLLDGVPLRQLCLLYCLLLVQKRIHRMEFCCKDVISEYRRFVNEFDNSMGIEDSVLYKDIDELVSLSAIKLKTGADFGQLEFRKIFLNIEEETIMTCFKNRAVPQRIQHWIET